MILFVCPVHLPPLRFLGSDHS